MNPAPDSMPEEDEEFTDRLLAFEEALANGTPIDVPEGTSPDLLLRLLRGLACVQRLRQLRPQRQPPHSLSGADDGCPARIGRFEIRCMLGRGGFGIVYRAYDPVLCREVALKIPRADVLIDADGMSRFQREAQAAAGLNHPNLVPVHEAGQLGPICYIAFAYCPGSDLSEWLKQRTAPVRCVEAARLVLTLARAIHHAHHAGVLHRDLKPSNVLLSPVAVPASTPADDLWLPEADTPLVPRVTDFGLAKFAAGDQASTQTGHMLGTPTYMAPEQFDDHFGEVSPATDVYGLGVILYELLAGRPPFWAESPMATLLQVKNIEPVPPSRLRPELPRDLETICLKCLNKEPRKRYQSAEELAQDIRRYLAMEPIKARRIGLAGRALRWCRRNPYLAAVTGSAAAAILILSTVYHANLVSALDETRAAGQRTVQALDKADRQRELAEKNRLEVVKERDEVEKNRQWAIQESEHARDNLCRSLFEQAHSLRISHQIGRRWRTLELLAQAEALRTRQRDVPEPRVGLPSQMDLRTEAVSALLLQDGLCLLERNHSGMQPFITDDGRFAYVPWFSVSTRQGGLQLLDLARGQEIARFDDIFFEDKEKSASEALAEMTHRTHSPEGKWLALRGKKEVRLWQFPEAKQSVLSLPNDLCKGNHLGFKSLAFSPNERFLAGIRYEDDRCHLVLWNLMTNAFKTLGQVSYLGPGSQIVFSPRDRFVACSSTDKKVTLWSLNSEKTYELDVPEQPYAMVFSPDEHLLVVHCADVRKEKPTCIFWDFRANTKKEKALHPGGSGQTVVFSRTGRLLAYCDRSEKGQRRIILYRELGSGPAWPLNDWSRFVLKIPESAVKIDFSADDQFMVVACGEPWGERMKYIVFDIASLSERARFVPSPSPGSSQGKNSLQFGPPVIPALAFGTPGNRLAIGHGMGNISILDPDTGKETYRLESAHRTPVFKIDWQPDGRQLTAVTRDGILKTWKLSDDSPLAKLQTATDVAASSRTAVSPGGKWLATQVDRKTQLTDRATGKVARQLPVHGPMFFRSDGQKLAVLVHEPNSKTRVDFVLERARAVVMDVATGKQDAFLDVESLQSAAFGPGGDLLVVCKTSTSAVAICNVNTGSQVWQPPAEAKLQYGILSPDGVRLMGLESPVGSTRLTLWEAGAERNLAETTMPRVGWSGSVPPPIFSPDGRWAAVPVRGEGMLGRGTTIFRLPSFEKAFVLPPSIFPAALVFSPESRLLVQSHFDGTISLWHLQRGEELLRFQAAPSMVENLCFISGDDLLAFSEKESSHFQVLELDRLRRQLAKVDLGW